MENRKFKIMAIAALIICVIGLSVGFAAFANTLTINSTSNVTPDNNLNVTFGNFTCTPAIGSSTATVVANSSSRSLSVSANMKHPGDTVVCTGQIDNANTLDAYLNSVTGIGSGTA